MGSRSATFVRWGKYFLPARVRTPFLLGDNSLLAKVPSRISFSLFPAFFAKSK